MEKEIKKMTGIDKKKSSRRTIFQHHHNDFKVIVIKMLNNCFIPAKDMISGTVSRKVQINSSSKIKILQKQHR